MTTATRYYNDTQELNVYFVERWRGDEYGDQDTTLLLKGLHIVCRYRFLFLEVGSKFHPITYLLLGLISSRPLLESYCANLI